MTITMLCAGALALPGGSEDSARSLLLTRYAPREDGAAARLLARRRAPAVRHDDSLVPRELPDEAWLRERFAVGGNDAIAAFALHAIAGAADCDPGSTLLVRPVHLHVGLDHLMLAVPQAGEIVAEESTVLADAANALFGEDELCWSPDTPNAWTLRATRETGGARLRALATLHCRSARLAGGRNIDAWQPTGDAARAWRAILNELQMLWHEHP
ncbi:MAG: hypothetical protein ACLGHY_12050, partial [Gammaproteobacteria bacterium]